MTNSYEIPDNYVHISGETNINCFECKYDEKRDSQNANNVLLMYPRSPGNTIETYIPISNFECNNSAMYTDFQELLQAQEYPYIKIEIDPLQLKNILPQKTSLDLNVAITIANITNVQPISCSVNSYSNSTVSIAGEAIIHLPDYQIEPPVKFMGLVKVRDEVTISFSFNFIVV
jgi:hypothetical protein